MKTQKLKSIAYFVAFMIACLAYNNMEDSNDMMTNNEQLVVENDIKDEIIPQRK